MNSSNEKFDREEQRIHNAFSQINVDTEKLKRRINTMNQKPIKRYSRFSIAAAVVLVFVTLSATTYAATGGLDQFLSRFNPAFGALAIAPAEPAYAEDQGIRLEVVGAQQINNVVLVYVTMQDIAGENRLSRYKWPDLEIFMDGQVMHGPSSSRLLHFDRNNNTLYFERIIAGNIGIPRADTLEIGATSIIYTGPGTAATGQMQTFAQGEWKMQINTSDVGAKVLTWTDIPAGDVHIEYMSLSPLGVQIAAGYIDPDSPWGWETPQIEIEVEGRWRNIRPSGSGGGGLADDFEIFYSVSSPIDVEAVTAVIVNGTRITPLQ